MTGREQHVVALDVRVLHAVRTQRGADRQHRPLAVKRHGSGQLAPAQGAPRVLEVARPGVRRLPCRLAGRAAAGVCRGGEQRGGESQRAGDRAQVQADARAAFGGELDATALALGHEDAAGRHEVEDAPYAHRLAVRDPSPARGQPGSEANRRAAREPLHDRPAAHGPALARAGAQIDVPVERDAGVAHAEERRRLDRGPDRVGGPRRGRVVDQGARALEVEHAGQRRDLTVGARPPGRRTQLLERGRRPGACAGPRDEPHEQRPDERGERGGYPVEDGAVREKDGGLGHRLSSKRSARRRLM